MVHNPLKNAEQATRRWYFFAIITVTSVGFTIAAAITPPASSAWSKSGTRATEITRRRVTAEFDITPKAAAKAVAKKKAYLIDVREKAEILDGGMAAPAKWLSTEEIQMRGNKYEAALRTWPKDMPLIFYCVSGRRAGIAARHFKELGYTTSVMGRYRDWQAEGLPTRPKP